MIRRLSVTLPPDGHAAIRLLAVSDEIEPGLWEYLDREAIGRLDLLVSCGDLPPDYLCYLEGTLRVPFLYVTGNHDLDDTWRHEAARLLPARDHHAELTESAGVEIALLDWPGDRKERTGSQERTAWGNVLGVRLGAAVHRRAPLIVASHIAPHDAGDPRDVYHRGLRAYGWLAEQLQPALWLHGHTTAATEPERVVHIGTTTCVNVTGAYLIELLPERPSEAAAPPAAAPWVSSPDGLSGDPRVDPRPAARTGPRPD